MAVKNLKSLVLRGASVLRDGEAVGLRLGVSNAVVSRPRMVPFISPRHGGCGVTTESEGRGARGHTPDADNPDAPRAGRSVRRAGVPYRRAPATAGGTTSFRWSASRRGASRTAAMSTGRMPAWPVAPVTKAPGQARQCFQPPCWGKPAGRAPQASTRGQRLS